MSFLPTSNRKTIKSRDDVPMVERSIILFSRTSFLSELIGGTKDSEGNVFIDIKPVCDDYWDLNDAKVACRQLGFSNAVRATAGKDTKF